MKKKEPELKTMADISVYLLFLLDCIKYPISEYTLRRIIADNVTLTTDYEVCLQDLATSAYVYSENVDGERYYMISERGSEVSAQLYDSLDPVFRQKSEDSAMKYLSLANRDVSLHSEIVRTQLGHYRVVMSATEDKELVMHTEVTVKSQAEAEHIRDNFLNNPDGVYRGILFSVTGKLGYIS